MGRELGSREDKEFESTHLSIFYFGDTFTFIQWDQFSLYQFFMASIGLTKDRERSETVACARTYNYK